MIIIPIGVDCGLASLLKKNNLRQFSLPFDWIVTYSGVSRIINNDFHLFLPNDGNSLNKMYDLCFYHNKFPEDYEKMNKRIDRLRNLLKSNEDIIFIRRGHALHHHFECDAHGVCISNDISDAENLKITLELNYPSLKYKIIVILVCDICFDKNKTYSSSSGNIYIYNIVTHGVDDAKFESAFNEIKKIHIV